MDINKTKNQTLYIEGDLYINELNTDGFVEDGLTIEVSGDVIGSQHIDDIPDNASYIHLQHFVPIKDIVIFSN